MIGTFDSESTSKNSLPWSYEYSSSNPFGTFKSDNKGAGFRSLTQDSINEDYGHSIGSDQKMTLRRMGQTGTMQVHSIPTTRGITMMLGPSPGSNPRFRHAGFLHEALDRNTAEDKDNELDPLTAEYKRRKLVSREDKIVKYELYRKIFRFAISTIVFCVLYFFYMTLFQYVKVVSKVSLPNNGLSLELNINNSVIIFDKGSSAEVLVKYSVVEGIYKYSYPFESFQFFDELVGSLYRVNVSNPHKYEIQNSKITISYGSNNRFSKLNITCTACIIYGLQDIVTDIFILNTEHTDANLKSLHAGDLEVFVGSGNLQINILETENSANFHLRNTTTYIQTRNDYITDLIDVNKDYCLSAAHLEETSEIKCIKTEIEHIYHAGFDLELIERDKCVGTAKLCSTASCSTSKKWTIQSIFGSLYINVVGPETFLPKSDAEILKGSVFDDPMKPTDLTLEYIQKELKLREKTSSLPLLIVFDIQNARGLSTSGVRWIASNYNGDDETIGSYLAYSSFNLLVSNVLVVDLKLSPGVCPFRTSVNKKILYEQMNMIKSILETYSKDSYNISFVKMDNMNIDNDDYMDFNGISDNFTNGFKMGSFVDNSGDQIKSMDEESINIKLRNERKLSYSNVLGRLLSFIVGIIVTYMIYVSTTFTFDSIKKAISQKQNYLAFNFAKQEFHDFDCMIENNTRSSDERLLLDYIPIKTNTWLDYDYYPSVTFYIKFLLSKHFMKRIDSVQMFFKFLFKEVKEEDINDLEIRMGTVSSIEAKEMLLIYQQFCFWNMLNESNLFSFESISILNKMGYKVRSKKEGRVYLNKILIKKFPDVDLSENDLNEYKSSLHSFLEFYIVRTNYDTDEVPLEVFEHHYLRFCNTFHIESKIFDVNTLKNEFNIDALLKIDKIIEREVNEDSRTRKTRFFCFKEARKMYSIDIQSVSEYILMASKFIGDGDTYSKRPTEIAKTIIFNQKWLLIEFTTCLIVISTLFSLDILLFLQNYSDVLLQEFYSYKQYLLPPPSSGLLGLVPTGYLGEYDEVHILGIALKDVTFVIFFITIIISFALDRNIFRMHRSINSNTRYFLKLNSIIQWGIFYFSIMINVYALTMFIHSYMLACTIKPTATLPYASLFVGMFALFGYFVFDYKRSRACISEKLIQDLKNYSANCYIERVNTASIAHEKMEDLRRIDNENLKSNILITEMPIPENEIEDQVKELFKRLQDDQQLDKNWADFLVAVLLKKKDMIKSCLKDIVEVEPVALPQGSLQLILEVLFSTEYNENSDYLFESLVAHVLKMIMRNERLYLKKLKLEDVQMIDICGCPLSSIIDITTFMCSNCKNPSIYTSSIRDEISRIMIEKNTSIFLSFIELIDYVRKKETHKILPLFLEKILPEGFKGGQSIAVGVIMRLIMLCIVDLDENFDRMELNACINDIFKEFMEVESNILTMMNMIEDLTDDNAIDLNMKPIVPTYNKLNFIKRSIIDPSINANSASQTLSRFISFSSILLGNDYSIPDDLVKNYTMSLNREKKYKISEKGVRLFMETLLYYKITPGAILKKIKENAKKYEIDEELSSSILYIKSVTSELNRYLEIENYNSIENTSFFKKIRQKLNLKSNLLLGLIYFINTSFEEDEVIKFLSYLCRKKGFGAFEKNFIDLVMLAVSKEYDKLRKAFSNFNFSNLKLYMYLRVSEDNSFSGQRIAEYADIIISELPVKSEDHEAAIQILREAIGMKSYSKYKNFIKFISRDNYLDEFDLKDSKIINLRTFQMLWEFSFETNEEKLVEVFKIFRYNFKDFDNHQYYYFCLKIFTLIGDMKLFKISRTLNRSTTESFSDLLMIKVQDIEKFLGIFQEDPQKFIVSINYFYHKQNEERLQYSQLGLMNHIVYVKSSIEYISNQINYFRTIQNNNHAEGKSPENQRLAIIIMRKILMPNVRLNTHEIGELLDNIIGKIFLEDGMEATSKIKKFYQTLFFDVLGCNGSYYTLGEYLEEYHNESFLKTLTACMSSDSRIQRTNYLFQDMMQRPLKNVTMFLYLYLFIRGIIQRDEFDEKIQIEAQFAQTYNIDVELFDFLELCLNQSEEKFDSLLLDIHKKRVRSGDKGDMFLKREDIDWGRLYSNILSLFSGETPDLPFFADLLQVPLSKLNFIYILNNLKNPTKSTKTLEELRHSISFREIVESLNVTHNEIMHLLMICLNKVSFQSLNEFIKTIKLEKEIDVNVLINLLVIDLRVEVTYDGCLEQFRKMNLYSDIFKQMNINKDIAWAIIRGLKGDFINFKKMLKCASNSKELPRNNKKYVKLIAAMIGCEKADDHLLSFKSPTTYIKVVELYNNIAMNRKKKDNTKEYAHSLIQEVLDIHPLWAVLQRSCTKKFSGNSGGTGETRLVDKNRFPGLNALVFQILLAISTSKNENTLPFFNLSFIWTARRFLKGITISNSVDASRLFENLKQSYERLYQSALESMIKSINEGRLFTLKVDTRIVNYVMADDLVHEQDSQNLISNHQKNINKALVEYWLEDLKKYKKVLPAEIENFRREFLEANSSSEGVGSLPFSEGSNFNNSAYKDRFMQCVVEKLLEEMDKMNFNFQNSMSRSTTEENEVNKMYEEDPSDIEEFTSSQNELQEQEEEEKSSVFHSSISPNHKPDKSKKPKFLRNGIMEFKFYQSLARLRMYKIEKYADKISHESKERFFENADLLFNVIEKLAIFLPDFEGFRKHYYMSIFYLSNGVMLDHDKVFRQSYSLFSPELVLYASKKGKVYTENCTIESTFEPQANIHEILGRLQAVSELMDYDKSHLSKYSPFQAGTFSSKMHTIKGSKYSLNIGDYYFAPFLMKIPLIKPTDFLALHSNSSKPNRFDEIIRNSKSFVDPAQVSIQMIEEGLYSFDYTGEDIKQLCSLYFNLRKPSDKMNSTIQHLERVRPFCYFLNDLAVGDMDVLVETQNIFTENSFLAKHHKLYNAFLHLHRLKAKARNFDRYSECSKALDLGFKSLGPYLKSNHMIVKNILIYVLFDNPKSAQELQKHLFQVTDVNASYDYTWSFMELASGTNKSKSLKSASSNPNQKQIWLDSFFMSKGLSQKHSALNKCLFRIFVKIKEKKPLVISKKGDDLESALLWFLNSHDKHDNARNTLLDILKKVIAEKCNSNRLESNEVHDDKNIENIYKSLVELENLTEEERASEDRKIIEASEAKQFLNFSLQVIYQKYDYFNEGEAELEYLLLNHFSVNNLNLLNLFKLLNWLKDKNNITPQEEIEKNFYEFLNYGNFNLMNLNIEKIKLLIIFLKNFNKAEVQGILQFLRDLQLTTEYVFILTHYVWRAFINGDINEKKFIEEKFTKNKLKFSLSHLSFFPFIDLIKTELIRPENSSIYDQSILEPFNNFRKSRKSEIEKVPFEKILTVIDTDLNNTGRCWEESYLKFIKGQAFNSLGNAFDKTYQSLFKDFDSTERDFRDMINSLYELFYFRRSVVPDREYIRQNNILPPINEIGSDMINDNSMSIMKGGMELKHKMSDVNILESEVVPRINSRSNFGSRNFNFMIFNYIEFKNYHILCKNMIEKLFDGEQMFDIEHILNKKIDLKPKTLIFMSFKSQNKEVKSKQLVRGGTWLWILKNYVIQMRRTGLFKNSEYRTKYKIIINAFLSEFYYKVLDRSTYEDFCKMTGAMINLFIGFKFKKNHDSIFERLVDFIEEYVFKMNRSFIDVSNKIKRIPVDAFFELKDTLSHDKKYSNRNPENIMRLCLNICRKLDFIKKTRELEQTYIKLIKLSSGDLDELEFFLSKLLKRNDKVSYIMSAIEWCERLIKGNQMKRKLKDKREVNARINTNKSAKFLHELTQTDQVMILKNLRRRGANYIDLFSFFQAGLPDSVNFNKFAVYKILRRMGYAMTIHRFIEITSKAIVSNRIHSTISPIQDSDAEFTHNDLENCLDMIEEKVLSNIFVCCRVTYIDAIFKALKSFLAYFLFSSIIFIAFETLWNEGEYGWAVNSIPIFVFIVLLMKIYSYNDLYSKDYIPLIKDTLQMLYGEEGELTN